ncbi:MAG TPA: biotin--[acetyl-CoA-carboxylase] ligase [Candidatus Baltobacteraceae bacterium]|jgi:BirA family biotin operon repressor/biotin-[acetyl-CoA-carboxylase] ligase|nr:biotin--[acetyl-CoA-carboxylase] ligase [Candidatus Baltobacteraceae bacterium]
MQDSGPYSAIAKELAGSAFAPIRYVTETASTNADAAALLGDEEARGLTIVAEHQTHGAGRKGRTWLAKPGTSLLFTTILPRPLPAADLWIVPFWTALAVKSALGECGIDASVVWPNDVLVAGGKVAGILCASRVSGDKAWAACGVGINVHRPDRPLDILPAPSYCDDVVSLERTQLLRAMLLAYDASIGALDNPQRVARLWERAAGIPGVRYTLLADGTSEPFAATALGLATGGGLVVARDDGTRETVSLADVRALR